LQDKSKPENKIKNKRLLFSIAKNSNPLNKNLLFFMRQISF